MLTVVKVGGSLFDLPDLRARLQQLLVLVDGPVLLVPGGGAVTNVVRRWDQTLLLGDATAHHLAMQTLSISAQFLAQLDSRFTVISNLDEVSRQQAKHLIPVLDCAELKIPAELPHTWDLTSDSIAACVANQLCDAKLLLVKSVSPPNSLMSAVRSGAVDAAFPRALQSQGISDAVNHQSFQWCNLREAVLRITTVPVESESEPT